MNFRHLQKIQAAFSIPALS